MAETITIGLNVFERRFLVYLSENKGRMGMDTNGLSKGVLDALVSLKDKGAMKIEDSMVLYYKVYSLTEVGINLVDLIKKEITT